MRDMQEPPVKVWLVWSNEPDAWWKPNRRGYTHDVWQAGRYDEAAAAEICRRAAHGWRGGSPPPEVMAARAEEATREAIAQRAAQQAGEAS